MKSLWPQLLAFCLGVLFLTGCSTDLHLSGVSITITDFRPTSATLLETQAALTLRYTNENVMPIAFSGATHKLYLNGTYVGKAVTKDAVGVPSLGSATQTVTVFLENLAMLQKVQSMAQSSSQVLSYKLESVLFVEAGEAHDTLKVTSNGQIDLSTFAPK